MRFKLVDGFLADNEGRRLEEGQTVEFKESISASCQREAIRSLVAFANSAGGRVFFGVSNDGLVRGVQSGQDTLERLAAKVAQHTYPPLLPSIDPIKIDGKALVVADMPSDTPPVVGVYVIREKPIAPDKSVEASGLEAFRRVGRRDQKEDFMRLRQPLPSDPRVRLQVNWADLYTDNPMCGILAGRVWAEEGSATANAVTFRLDPFGCESPTRLDDLPYPSLKTSGKAASMHDFRCEGFTSAADFEFPNLDFASVPETVVIIATYMDDWGLTWEVRRRISLTLSKGRERPKLEWVDCGEFRRRIVVFPPKMETTP